MQETIETVWEEFSILCFRLNGVIYSNLSGDNSRKKCWGGGEGEVDPSESQGADPGGKVLGSSFAGYVPLASQNPYPIIVYSVASYRPHLSHFWTNVIVISRMEFNASRLLNIKTTAGTIFQPQIFLFLNPCLPEFSYPKNPENLRPHSSNSTKNVTPL